MKVNIKNYHQSEMSTYPFFPLAEKFYNCSPCYKAILEEM